MNKINESIVYYNSPPYKQEKLTKKFELNQLESSRLWCQNHSIPFSHKT